MRQVALAPFPGMPHPETSITVELTFGTGRLDLRYRVAGAVEKLLLPPQSLSGRADGLWQHSCFEAFLRPESGDSYLEFNFAPSGQWAMYGFDGYRQGMRDLVELPAPRIESSQDGPSYELHAAISPRTNAAARLSLSAVIEEKSGYKSYWALAHPAEKPDFHHPDCFVLELPAAG